jgi:hypothetical protein
MIRSSSPHTKDGARAAAPLATRLDKQLFTYAAAAGAAGVGLLAAAQPAQARIIYKHASIPINVDATTPFDVNNDGATDFSFSNYYINGARRKGKIHRDEGTYQAGVSVGPAQAGNAIVEATSNGKVLGAAALTPGRHVGPKKQFGVSWLEMANAAGNYTGGGGASGPWLRVSDAYLGFKFNIKGKLHYGWARIKWNGLGETEYITGYAYETIANKSIKTGQKKGTDSASSATLGSLAQGASGLSAFRNK